MNARRILVTLAILLVALSGLLGMGILAAERPAGSVTGFVGDQQGHPLDHAKVVFSSDGTTRSTVTRADGTFRLDRLPVGRYNVQAHAHGYDGQWASPPVLVEEDHTVSDLRFALDPREPSLAFSHHTRVYTPQEPVRIGLRGTLISSLHVAVYRLDPSAFARTSNAFSGLAQTDPAKLGKAATLVKAWDRTLTARADDEDDWFYRAVEVPGALPKGTYLLRVTGKPERLEPGKPTHYADGYWFEVTTLSLVAKRSQDQSLVYAVDMVTRKPVPGVSLNAYDDQGKRWHATTDAHGLARTAYTGEDSLLVMGEAAGATAHVVSYYHSYRHEYNALVYTERPIYRPGHEVCYKAILRKSVNSRNILPSSLPVTVRVMDPQDNVVEETQLRTDAMGSIDGRIQLQDEPPLGEYRLVVLAGGDTHQATFQVQAYRKPEFKLDLKVEQPRVIQGDVAHAVVNAQYYFGAPVAGAKVHFNVYSAPTSPFRTEEDAFFGEFEGDDWGYSNIVAQGEAETDAAGRVAVDVQTVAPRPEEAGQDQRYTVELEAVDASRQVVKGKGSFLVTRGQFTFDAEPDRYVYQPGDTAAIALKAQDYDGKPIATPLTVELQRISYLNRGPDTLPEERAETVSVVQASTGPAGAGRASVAVPKSGGDYRLRVVARDAEGHRIEERVWLWVSSSEWAGTTLRMNQVTLSFDKKRYKPGDTAQVLVQLPSPQVASLITIEGQALYDAFVLESGKASQLIRVPVRAEYMPNAYVAATVCDGKAFHDSEKSLNLMPDAYFLDVKVTPGKPRYLPGETATLTVETRDHRGRPTSAEVSLGVVDEAIYALAPDTTPDIRYAFHGPHSNTVATNYSFAEDYSGGPGKDAGEPRLRKAFKDTAAWFPAIRTGPDGRATVEVPLPDNLTTWVVTARADDAETRVGATRATFLATKDLLVRLATPRFLVAGDRLGLAAMIHNYTDRVQEVALRLGLGNLTLDGRVPDRLKVDPSGVAHFDASVEARDVGTASVTLTARGQTAGDALQLSFPVLPHGVPHAAFFAGTVHGGGRWEQAFDLPRGAVNGTRRLAVSLMPTPAAGLRGALTYLAEYPYGCIEQTTSRIVPALHAARVLGADAAALPGLQDLDRRGREGVRKILGLQKADGGWGWFAGDTDDPELSAYALYGLAEAKAAGVPVDSQAAARGIAYLKTVAGRTDRDLFTRWEARRGGGPDALATFTWAMGAWGAADAGLRDRLVRHAEDLSSEGLALGASGLDSMGDARARGLWARLKAKAIRAGRFVHWESRLETDGWEGLATETTAQALTAGLRLEPDSPEVAGAVRWLLGERKAERWVTTRDTAAVAIALADATVRGLHQGLPPEASVELDGEPVATASFTGDARLFGATIPVPTERLGPGRHVLRVSSRGLEGRPAAGIEPAAGELPVSAELSYVEARDRLDAEPGAGLTIQREWLALDRKLLAKRQESPGGGQFTREQLASLLRLESPLKSQDPVLVRLTVQSDRVHRYMLIEDPLPAGAEVLDEPSGGWSAQEVHDDRMVFFASELATGSTEFYYVMRPELPGRYRALPPRVSAMYAPEVRASGAERTVQIRP